MYRILDAVQECCHCNDSAICFTSVTCVDSLLQSLECLAHGQAISDTLLVEIKHACTELQKGGYILNWIILIYIIGYVHESYSFYREDIRLFRYLAKISWISTNMPIWNFSQWCLGNKFTQVVKIILFSVLIHEIIKGLQRLFWTWENLSLIFFFFWYCVRCKRSTKFISQSTLYIKSERSIDGYVCCFFLLMSAGSLGTGNDLDIYGGSMREVLQSSFVSKDPSVSDSPPDSPRPVAGECMPSRLC